MNVCFLYFCCELVLVVFRKSLIDGGFVKLLCELEVVITITVYVVEMVGLREISTVHFLSISVLYTYYHKNLYNNNLTVVWFC